MVFMFVFSSLALDPDQALKRYLKVLEEFRAGNSLQGAYNALGVDRLTVVSTAPIAELYTVCRSKYEELRAGFVKDLLGFAKQCQQAIAEDGELVAEVMRLKLRSVKGLLPIHKRQK